MRTAIAIFIAALSATPAIGQEDKRASVEAQLNQAGICEELPDLDMKQIADLLGLGLPIPPFIDTGARWDKNRHTVTAFEHNGNNLRMDVTFGCQPSDEGAALKIVGVSGDRLRLADNATCTGQATADAADLSCQVSGELGKLLSSVIDLNSRVSVAVSKALEE